VLVADHLPELAAELVAALADLHGHDLSHGGEVDGSLFPKPEQIK
jgi:hypothetical protein